MIDVIRDALESVPGPEDQIVVLLQPSSPLRTPGQVREAIKLLEAEKGVDSVVSVTAVDGRLLDVCRLRWQRFDGNVILQAPHGMAAEITLMQDAKPRYLRNGNVYCFRRSTVTRYGHLYGAVCLPLVIPRYEALSIDTEEDWREAERRIATASSRSDS